MPLTEGTVLGSYRIVSLLGVGGMGEVYRARDSKLNRDVALKVLPDLFASDPDRLARFTREAQVLASLNHPNIAAIYGVEDRALVLELVEGATLADRMAQGAIPIGEALPIARQIAEALEAAHEQGIIHRDLKPANIKLRPDGTIKVLDFGLAAVTQGPDQRAVSATFSPTLTIAAATQAGLIMGTAAYMSPEQAAGKVVDKRTDIWSFGVVLLEMLTGRRLFDGETVSHTLADVLRAPIDFTALPSETPRAIRDLVERCLDRNAKTRLRDIGEARPAIDRGRENLDAKPALEQSSPSRWQSVVPWTVAGLALVVAGVLLVILAPWRARPLASVQRFSIDAGADISLPSTGSAALRLSVNGRMLALASRGAAGQLYLRRLDQLQATPLSGTAGASNPFFSPDGQWIGFFADGFLKRVSVTGGAALALTSALSVRGGSWDANLGIVFGSGTGGALMRMPQEGGNPQPLTMLADGETTHRYPQVLPGGKAVLYTAHTAPIDFEDANVVVQALPNGPRKVLQRGGYYGRYVPSGHVLYLHGGTLFALPFDIDRLEPAGSPVPVIQGIASNPAVGGAQYDVSPTGVLAYLPGPAAGTNGFPIQWLDRNGKTTPLRAQSADWSNPAFSSDGRRLAIDVTTDSRQTDIWTYDWSRDVLTRLTQGTSPSIKPVWTPDGTRIVFGSTRDGGLNLYWQRADGTGNAQRLTTSTRNQAAWSWHPNGKILAFHELTPDARDNVLMLPIDGDERTGWKPGTPTVFLGAPYAERAPMFSPDGRFVAYQSTETGQDEIYVVAYPGATNKVQISTGGGVDPTWSRARSELLYEAPDQRIMVVRYQVKGDMLVPERPQVWSEMRITQRQRTGPTRSFDLHPDGVRLAVAPGADSADRAQDRLVVVLNFFDELRRLAPPK